MAIAFVQSTTGRNTNPVFGSAVGNGSLIVIAVLIEDSSQTVSSITDNKSNSYSFISGLTRSGSSRLEIWYAENVTGGTSFTVTVNVTGGHKCISIHEYSGARASGAFDTHAEALSTDSGNITTAVADELLFGFGDRFTTVGASGSGYTQRENFVFNVGHATQDKLAGAAGSYNSTWANTQSSMLAAFKPPATFATHERAVSVTCTAELATDGERVVDRGASVDATGAIDTSGQFFSVFDRAIVVTGEAAIESAGVRIVDRGASVDATGAIDTSGQFFSVFDRAIAVTGAAAIESAGVRIAERSVSVTCTAAIAGSGQRVIDRSVAASATAAIVIAGSGFSTFARSATVSAAAGAQVSGHTVRSRSVAISAVASLKASGPRLANPARTYHVGADDRVVEISRAERTATIGRRNNVLRTT